MQKTVKTGRWVRCVLTWPTTSQRRIYSQKRAFLDHNPAHTVSCLLDDACGALKRARWWHTKENGDGNECSGQLAQAATMHEHRSPPRPAHGQFGPSWGSRLAHQMHTYATLECGKGWRVFQVSVANATSEHQFNCRTFLGHNLRDWGKWDACIGICAACCEVKLPRNFPTRPQKSRETPKQVTGTLSKRHTLRTENRRRH